jgi:tetratricopeptide (TPR) repeat protein
MGATLFAANQGWAKFGWSKTWINFNMHHPPAFYAPGRELRIEATSVDPVNANLANQLKAMFAQELIKANFKSAPGAETLAQFTINDIMASVERQTRLQTVNVHTGTHTEYTKNGKSYQVEDCQDQEHELTYLVSSGSLAANMQVTDTKSQAAVLEQVLEPKYNEESVISGPRQCGGKSWGANAGQLQSPEMIKRALIAQAVRHAIALTVGYDEPRKAMVTVDDELKPGNAYAAAGNWQQAFETWNKVQFGKDKEGHKEAARQYNLGLAHEVLAAEAMRNEKLDEATKHLADGEKCYQQALALDSGEKYYKEILARLQRDRAVLQKEQEHAFMKQAAEMAAEPPPSAAAAPLTVDIPLEGWPTGEAEVVHTYRQYVRTKVEAQTTEPNQPFKEKLIAAAADYEVKEGIALRVVDSEVMRFLIVRRNMEKYKDDFKDAAADGTVTADERAALRGRQKVLHLSDTQVKQVESQFRVKE